MQIYKVTGDKSLRLSSDELRSGGVMVKIRKVMPSILDVDYFSGKKMTREFCPCHMATAYVSDDYPEYGFKQGEKVLLNPYRETDSIDSHISGVNEDGFLREFCSLDPSAIIPLPETVDEDDALFTDLVAIALSAFSDMHAEKGDYIAVIGGGVLSVIIARLAVYYGYVPVFVSADKSLIDIATSCGVYYTVNSTTEDVKGRVLEITGGRLAERTILEGRDNVVSRYLFALAADNGESVIVSVHDNYSNLTTDLHPVLAKNLRVYGVSEGRKQFGAALNVLARGVLDLKGLIDKTVDFKDAEELFLQMSENRELYVAPVIVVEKK